VPLVRPRPLDRALLGLGAAGVFASLAGVASAQQTNLQETEPLLWVLIAISVAGALVTYAFLAYALWRYRDPHTRGRRYG
jgi:amino acid transporter